MTGPSLLFPGGLTPGVGKAPLEGFSFEGLSGLQFLGDPARISGVSVDGTAVSSWTELSAGRHAVQATGANQPLFKTNVFGSLPSVRFDGSDDFLKTASFATISQPYTIAMVYKAIAYPDGIKGLVSEGGGGFNGLLADPSADIRLYAGGYLTGGAFLPTGGAHIIRGVFDGASSRIVIDGGLTLDATGNPGTGSLAGGIALGWFGSATPANADYGHVMVWDGTDVAEVESKLSSDYGIPIS